MNEPTPEQYDRARRTLEAISAADGQQAEYIPVDRRNVPADIPRVKYDPTALPDGHPCPACGSTSAACTICGSQTPMGAFSHCPRPACVLGWQQDDDKSEPRNACAGCGRLIARDLSDF